MHSSGLFEIPQTVSSVVYLAEVISVHEPSDPGSKPGYVKVRLLNYDGVADQDGPVWARVAAPFAGASCGAFMIPNVNDEVLVAFLNGDPRLPMVIGSMWNGKATPPESLSNNKVDRWTIVGKAGTRIAIIEESGGQEQIKLSTPGGVTCLLTDQGTKVEIKAGSNTITMDSSGVTIKTGGTFKVNASKIDLSAGQVNVDTAMTKMSGITKTDVIRSTTVSSSTYTPGAGNIW
jgi:uncharacterized protein involved in type VI secretion and phage assembly